MMKVKLLLITVLIVFSMCSCNKPISQENKVNITLLHGFGGESKEDIIMRKIYKEFEEKNTDISLTLVSVPSFNQVLEKAKDLLVIGKAPNIIYNGNSDSGTVYKFMVEKGYCTLSEYLSQTRSKMRLQRSERDKTGKAEITRDRANLTRTILRVCDSNNEKNGQNFISVFEVMKNKRIIG